MNSLSGGRPESSAADLTIVCCVEFGRLEEQTVLMVRTLRTFGGRFADVPVMAIVGRKGAPLRTETVRELTRLGVTIVRARASDNPAPWLNYANKVAAVLTADRLAKTTQIAWLDSDIFILKEPAGLLLQGEEQLAARNHFLPPAVLEGDSSHVEYWTRICKLFAVDFEDVPWIEGTEGFPRQKLSFNSGIFSWRRGSGFAQLYADGVKRILAGRIAQHTGEFFTIDQVVFTPMIVRESMNWRNLPIADHRLLMGGFLESDAIASPPLSEARLLHYSNCFNDEFRDLMNRKLEREIPGFFAWLGNQKLNLGRQPRPSRFLAKALKLQRGIRYRIYGRSTVAAI